MTLESAVSGGGTYTFCSRVGPENATASDYGKPVERLRGPAIFRLATTI